MSWVLPIVGLGLVWLLAPRSTRMMGLVVVGFTAAVLAASALHVYPITRGRTDIFAFPMVIVLAVMGVHALSARLPRREFVRTAAGFAAAAWAVSVPLRPEYWAVDDVRLVKYVSVLSTPADGLILSPNGTYLTAYYGHWPVEVLSTSRISNATAATIGRPLTLYLQRDEAHAHRSIGSLPRLGRSGSGMWDSARATTRRWWRRSRNMGICPTR